MAFSYIRSKCHVHGMALLCTCMQSDVQKITFWVHEGMLEKRKPVNKTNIALIGATGRIGKCIVELTQNHEKWHGPFKI